MTVKRDENTQWGNALVQVKEHPRKYRTGEVIVPTYSAKCPDSQKRKRLKKRYGSIYVMDCGKGEVEVDIQSGNYVKNVVISVSSYPPSKTQLISASEFERTRRRSGIYGSSQILFNVDEMQTEDLLDWWLVFTNPEMTEGVGMALLNGEHIYIKFASD